MRLSHYLHARLRTDHAHPHAALGPSDLNSRSRVMPRAEAHMTRPHCQHIAIPAQSDQMNHFGLSSRSPQPNMENGHPQALMTLGSPSLVHIALAQGGPSPVTQPEGHPTIFSLTPTSTGPSPSLLRSETTLIPRLSTAVQYGIAFA